MSATTHRFTDEERRVLLVALALLYADGRQEDSFALIKRISDEALEQAQDLAGPRFEISDGDAPTHIYRREDMLLGNRDLPEFCEWLRSARVGDSWTDGGGAAPEIVTRRVQ